MRGYINNCRNFQVSDAMLFETNFQSSVNLVIFSTALPIHFHLLVTGNFIFLLFISVSNVQISVHSPHWYWCDRPHISGLHPFCVAPPKPWVGSGQTFVFFPDTLSAYECGCHGLFWMVGLGLTPPLPTMDWIISSQSSKWRSMHPSNTATWISSTKVGRRIESHNSWMCCLRSI